MRDRVRQWETEGDSGRQRESMGNRERERERGERERERERERGGDTEGVMGSTAINYWSKKKTIQRVHGNCLIQLKKRQQHSSYPNSFTTNGRLTRNKTYIVNGFNDFFVNVGTNLARNIRVPSGNFIYKALILAPCS